MKKNRLIKFLACFLCFTLILGTSSVFAEEVKEEGNEKEEVLTDAEIVRLDKEALDIGFILCVSRDLKLPIVGENGSAISWQSTHPDLMSNDGKYTKPEKITEVTLTATIKKGSASDKKVFTLTLNDRTMYEVIIDYVETMIKYGRDNHGFSDEEYERVAQTYSTGSSKGTGPMDTPLFRMAGRSLTPKGQSGLFFSILDRETLQYPAYYVKDWPRNGYNSDERGSGCNTGFDYWLYNILYELSLLTGDESYRKIADDNLYFFVTYCQHPEAGPLAWGLHTVYDPVTGSVNTTNQYATTRKEQDTWSGYTEPGPGDREAMANPFFMNKLYELNPRAMDNHMMSWWEATVSDQKNFAFGRHTDWAGSGNALGGYLSMTNPMAYAYAWGYHYSGNYEYLRALNSLMSMVERVSNMNKHGLFVQDLYLNTNRSRQVWTEDMLWAAEVFSNILPLIPEHMHERFQNYLDHFYEELLGYEEGKGFYRMNMLRDGQVTAYMGVSDVHLRIWRALGDGSKLKEEMTQWIMHWMNTNEFYPLTNKLSVSDYFPRTIAEEMNNHLICYEETGEEKFLDRLLEYADFAIYDFWEMESLLPSMTHAQKRYYESSWGSVAVVDAIWQAYFKEIERKTGVNPKEEAWEKANYAPKSMLGLAEDDDFLNATKSVIGGTTDEE